MEDYVIHKVIFTEEAVFDYENCLIVKNYQPHADDSDWQIESKHDLPLVRLPKSEMKHELEEYIQSHTKNKYKHYFRVKFYDEMFNRELILFIKQGLRISIMQNWLVAAICFASDWTNDDEEEGRIRSWVETKITNLPDSDWVEEERFRHQQEEDERLKDEREREYYERLFT